MLMPALYYYPTKKNKLSVLAQRVISLRQTQSLTAQDMLARQLITSAQLAQALAELLFLPYIDVTTVVISSYTLSLFPLAFIEQYQVLPFLNDQEKISLAIANVDNFDYWQILTTWIGQPIQWYIADAEKLSLRIAKLLHQQAQGQLTEDASVVDYVEKLFMDAVCQHASDIHIELYTQLLRVRLRIDGLLYEQAHLPKEIASRLLTHIKILAQLDITEKRLPQDGRLQLSLSSGQTVDCRINVCPTLVGEKIVLRLLNTNAVDLHIDHLGFETTQKQQFLTALHQPQGMVLVTGPTGSGKTITLYTALTLLNKATINISSIEDPVEIILPGINQVPINYKIELTFAKVLRALLRQDPDVIMVGEMRDRETAAIALQAAQTGHLVLSTLHTNNAAQTITRLLQMGIAPYQLAASLTLIIAQRLIRLLCPHCKKIDDFASQAFNAVIYQAVGCDQCQQGYKGRTAIYECLPISLAIKQAILLAENNHFSENQFYATEMLTLSSHGWQKIRAGLTTPAELARVAHLPVTVNA